MRIPHQLGDELVLGLTPVNAHGWIGAAYQLVEFIAGRIADALGVWDFGARRLADAKGLLPATWLRAPRILTHDLYSLDWQNRHAVTLASAQATSRVFRWIFRLTGGGDGVDLGLG